MEITRWQDIHWDIELSEPPEVVQIGIRVHGRIPIERYRLIGLWCLHLYRYEASVNIDGIALPIRPGFAGIIPADTNMEYRFQGRSPHLFVHFRCHNTPQQSTVRIPAMQDLGDSFGRIFEQMEDVIERNDRSADARLWDVLWQLSQSRVPQGITEQSLHPAVRKTVLLIDQQLSDVLKVASLADRAGISTSYLSRLFQEAFGQTVISYIRDRRVKRAAHLLRQSTLPIKTIAGMVGIPDLQHFNRTIHKVLYRSPQQVRVDAASGLIENEAPI